jgi:enoyl-CoA hydratase/carnithine racemase
MNDTTTLESDLLYEVRDGIGRITFNRPQARNALTFNMYRRSAQARAATARSRC